MRVFALASIILAALVAAWPVAGVVHQDASPESLASVSEVEPGGEMARLSPDGSRIAILAHDGSTELCIREVETLEDRCGDIGITSRDLQTVSWSPDGTALVFTSDPLITGLDSDIRMVNAASGEVTNLTDDAADVLAAPGSTMDVHPGWSADGTAIVFQRYHEDGVSLMRLPRDGGEPEEIVAFPPEYATVMSGPAFTLADGTILLATMPATGFTTGIFRVSPDGEFEHLASDDLLARQDSLVLLDVTADGSLALVYGRPGYEIRFHGGAIGLLDLRTGEIDRPEAVAGEPLAPATFAPDDTEILSASMQDDGASSLVRSDLITGEIIEVLTLDPTADDDPLAMWPLVSLVWAENDLALLHTGTPTSVMVDLG